MGRRTRWEVAFWMRIHEISFPHCESIHKTCLKRLGVCQEVSTPLEQRTIDHVTMGSTYSRAFSPSPESPRMPCFRGVRGCLPGRISVNLWMAGTSPVGRTFDSIPEDGPDRGVRGGGELIFFSHSSPRTGTFGNTYGNRCTRPGECQCDKWSTSKCRNGRQEEVASPARHGKPWCRLVVRLRSQRTPHRKRRDLR